MADESPTPTPAPAAGPAPASPFVPITPATGEDALGDAGKNALNQERTARKEAERQAATLQRELEQARMSSLSEAEKAIETARAETRAEVVRTFGGRLVEAEVRAASAARLQADQVDALLEGLDRTRFITADGDVDRDALTSWIARVAPPSVPGPAPFGDVDQGVRTTPPATGSEERALARSLFGGTT